jgi:hypothetical protein
MSDDGTYPQGHWERVYTELHDPAIRKAGLTPQQAGLERGTGIIMLGVLRQLFEAEMVLCDTSALRANVFFELGLRQAFDKPVVIVHDERTERPFDVAGLRDYTYNAQLRVDQVRTSIEEIGKAIRETADPKRRGESSLVRLLEIKAAELPETGNVNDSLLRSIATGVENLNDRFGKLEYRVRAMEILDSPVLGSRTVTFPYIPLLGMNGPTGPNGPTGGSVGQGVGSFGMPETLRNSKPDQA